MKIYIVEWFAAEQYCDYSGPLKAFVTREQAQEFIDSHQDGPYDADPEEYEEGWLVSPIIKEIELEGL